MIKLPPVHEDLEIELYDENGEHLCHIHTTIQFYDIRCQIKELNLPKDTFYTFTMGYDTFKIDSDGRLEREAKSDDRLYKIESYLDRLLG